MLSEGILILILVLRVVTFRQWFETLLCTFLKFPQHTMKSTATFTLQSRQILQNISGYY